MRLEPPAYGPREEHRGRHGFPLLVKENTRRCVRRRSLFARGSGSRQWEARHHDDPPRGGWRHGGILGFWPAWLLVVKGDLTKAKFPDDPSQFDRWIVDLQRENRIDIVADWRLRRRSSTAASRARTRSRKASWASSGTHTGVSSPARNNRASEIASRRLVLTRTPGLRGISDGATTMQS